MLDIHGACTHVDQDVRNLDLDRANLAACATQGRGEGKGVNRILLIQALGELRGEDRTDGSGVDRTIGVAGSVLVDRADVHAGPTTDTRKSLATNRVGRGLSAAIKITWNSWGPSPGVTPVHIEV